MRYTHTYSYPDERTLRQNLARQRGSAVYAMPLARLSGGYIYECNILICTFKHYSFKSQPLELIIYKIMYKLDPQRKPYIGIKVILEREAVL